MADTPETTEATAVQQPGKEAVRARLIDQLQAAGIKRARGTTAEQAANDLAKLEARLAYMSAASLDALCEVVERNADGPRGDRWPAALLIYRWARKIEPPPVAQSRLVVSYMRSQAGKDALAADQALELVNFLKGYGRPPVGPYFAAQIAESAEQRRRRVSQLERLDGFGGGAMKEDARLELAWHHEQLEAAAQLVAGNDGAQV
jgi:hypothetical protein